MVEHIANIPWAKPIFWGLEEEYVLDALRSTWISGGPYVDRFESDICKFSGAKEALAVSNGTTAIHLVYLGLGLIPGDEIIVPGFCYQAAANIGLQMGLYPRFADIDPKTYCITANSIEPLISLKTRLIVAVHTYGNVCAMDEIVALAHSRGILVLEDAAESFGSRLHGRQSGSIGDFGTYSFQATKSITTGEGGIVLGHDNDLIQRMKLFRSHGVLGKRYWHEVPGHNFRLSNIQAALGCAQFARFDQIVAGRKRVELGYQRLLGDVGGVSLQNFTAGVDPVLWTQAVEIHPGAFPQGRDAVISQLALKGIETRNAFYSANQLEIYGEVTGIPNSDSIASNVLCLPTYPSLSEEDLEFISSSLLELRC